MIFKILLISTIALSQVDLSHTKFCHSITKLAGELSRNPENKALLRGACENGDGKAFFLLKEKNENLPEIAKNNLAKRGCDRGYTPACIYLSKNLGNSSNPEKTLKELRADCIQGKVTACAALGIVQNKEKQYPEALKSFNFACESGDGESCYMMGKIYEKQGRVESALKMHKYACDSKNASRSCLFVGKNFQKNEASNIKAIHFYLKKACAGAIEEGCFLLNKR